MSRIGQATISIPAGVDVTVGADGVTVKGPKGSLTQELPETISVAVEDGTISVTRTIETSSARALHGLIRSLVNNMVIGVTEGFRKDLEIVGVGYRAVAKGTNKLEMQLGYSHPVHVVAPDGIEFDVPQPTQIGVVGIDKQVVGQVAAEIRSYRKPEPYKGKGIRYVGEHVRRKAGKAAK
jgi:large subunit ribosomal protein L6